MSNVLERLAPNPVNHEFLKNGCCADQRAWEMEMMRQVWGAGLHDAANCFQDALEAKWKLDAKKVIATNGDRIRAMTDEEFAEKLMVINLCPKIMKYIDCASYESCGECWLEWLKAPVEESHE